ncbi:hypothetical protein HK104_008730 [Borealophlyctis nickersoniae]|nr:hypothetical protein HK104_008730 [Borealophlyctis nickersoniae]
MSTSTRKRKWDVGGDATEHEAQRVKVAASEDSKKVDSPAAASDEASAEDRAAAAAQAAALAAARINSVLAAQGLPRGGGDAISTIPRPGGAKEEFVKDIEINDIKNRYILTKGATQLKIKQDTGAEVITRGKYYPDKKMATEQNPPLYLHVTAESQADLDKAVEEIEKLMNQAQMPMPPMEPDRRMSGDRFGGPRPPLASAKVFVNIDDRSFNTRAKIVGPGGQYVKHIQQETSTRVQLKGRGSGYIEHGTGEEAPEPLHVHITGHEQSNVDRAQRLCEDLINTVRVEYERLKQERAARPPPPPRGYGSPYGVPGGYGAPGGPYGPPGAGYGYPPGPPGQYQPPPPPGAAAPPPPPPGASYGQPAGQGNQQWANPATTESASAPYAYPQQDGQQQQQYDYSQYAQYYGYDPSYYQQYSADQSGAYSNGAYGTPPAGGYGTPPAAADGATENPPLYQDENNANGESYNAVPPPKGL